MVHSLDREQATLQTTRRARCRKPDKQTVAKHSGGVFGALIGGLLKSLAAKLILATVLAALAYFGVIARVAHLPTPLSQVFHSHTTITTSAVLTKLTKIEQVHVATGTYKVNVKISQSVFACWLICNKMQLQGTGTDDAILNLSALTAGDVAVNDDGSSVTIWMQPPTIGPAILDPANCNITSSHGVINTLTQSLRNNPNGYKPLYVEGEAQIHDQAVNDPALLTAGEQSARQLFAQVLGTIGVKQVTVNFI